MIRVLLTVILLVVSINHYAQTSDSLRILKLESEMASIISEKKQKKLTDSLKLLVYEQKIESLSNELKSAKLSNEFAAKNANRVTTAFFTVLAIFAALGIWNMIVSNRNNRREIEKIKKSINEQTDEEFKEINKKISDNFKSNKQSIDNNKSAIWDSLDSRVDSKLVNVNAELDKNRAYALRNTLTLTEMINKEKFSSITGYSLIKYHREIEFLMELLRLSLEIEKKSKNELRTSYAYNLLPKIMKIVEEQTFDTRQRKELIEVLNKVDDYYKDDVRLIIERIKVDKMDPYM